MYSKPQSKPDSSSSSSDDAEPISRRPIKNKRRNRELWKQVVTDDLRRKKVTSNCRSGAMCSESGSEKESGASRDSDSSSTSGSSAQNLVPDTKKRKTPVKGKISDENCEPLSKVLCKEVSEEGYLQNDSCAKAAPRQPKCRECHKFAETNQYSCRFFSFRKLRVLKSGYVARDGFSSPQDAQEADAEIWSPNCNSTIDVHIARFILMQVGDQFCDLLRQEEDAVNIHMGANKQIAWKKPMQGVREMCDVCKTTLFNFHWACTRCGFVVCIDCYKVRRNGIRKSWMSNDDDHDEWKWVFCTNQKPHMQEKLMLCQTIAQNCLKNLGQLAHDAREMFGIPQACKCPLSQNTHPIAGVDPDQVKELVKLDPLNAIISNLEKQSGISNGSAAAREHEERMVNEAAHQRLPDEESNILSQIGASMDSSSDSDEDDSGGQSSLRDLLISSNNNINTATNGPTSAIRIRIGSHTGLRTSTSPYSSRQSHPQVSLQPLQTPSAPHCTKSPKISRAAMLDDVISSVSETSEENGSDKVMQHYIRLYQGYSRSSQNQLPIRYMTLVESQLLYPEVPHSWLCDGKLLRLIDPSHSGNYRIFEDQWRRGQPVIVGNMTKLLNMSLWRPESFCNDFGDQRNDLINCATGKIVPNRPMREFWEGFQCFSKRLKDGLGNPMLLKLKDWPPGEDFATMLPKRFADLMQALPLAEYTHRSGRLNLASCLPDFFVRPDLGPKMYNAYGSSLLPSKGTTNLHLDISDAVNFMVYVGIPQDGDSNEHIEEAYRAIDEANCDIVTRRRVRLKEEMPGALWHIYHARDSDKIRDLLNKVAIEQGVRLEPHHDPIHDQSWYLDGVLRERLYREYGVTGYAIVQCLGDAVFIPAGAPHQVRNLHNCIKVAEDFVSPENVSQCFHLTQEFRELSDTHTNHEDKLQIKNIIYHAIKDAVSSLMSVGASNICNGKSGIKSEVKIEPEESQNCSTDFIKTEC